ncbi:Non-specific serine/threonine protein kinase [Ascochyta rabiei]|uniref:Non-specific serine/threonine protein kinase n=1 Tax=Didymella rabiei TaxID=5454 RepID=UPI0021F9E737|nr:Non-specific serine/threonine protein kinase [Ascochyta rabiei]UPX09817.1 Non-specific serine/threonine protein kinase [Ascochyta rabiei]
MAFASYSPHREAGTMHLDLPSPTYRLDGTHFAHLQQLRRSLSRSPSKPSRFQLHKSDSPRSPISPLALARAFSPKAHKPTSPIKTFFESPLAQAVPAKKKFTLRRPTANFKASPRARQNSKSPRRVLGDSPTGANSTTPFYTRPTVGQENDTPARPSSSDSLESMDTDCRKFGLNDKPIKFEFAHRRPDLSPGPPVKSSPLKRNDGVMNLSGTPTGFSPVAKRRSLHSVSNLGTDFESIFDRNSMHAVQSPMEEEETQNEFDFSTPANPSQSPMRRATSLRKSTVMQRNANSPRPKPAFDGEFAMPGLAASKSRNRMSLDSSLGQSTTPTQTPFRKSTFDAGRMGLPTPFVRSTAGASQPHPLSHAHTPSSTTSGLGGMTPMAPPRAPHFAAPPGRPNQSHQFSRSLPIGVPRPHAPEGEHDSFDTPFKSVQQAPVAFSTGLMSKKNRNADEPANVYVMPDTPSKRQSYPPAQADRTDVIDTPLVKRGGSLFGDFNRPQPQFGTTSTPFSAHVSKFSTGSFGKGTSVFGNMGGSLQRRGSMVSVDGDDDLPDSQSPTANRTMVDTDASIDDMPPTPTKGHGASSRRSKESSLRRKTFRSRPSIGNDTFAAPEVANDFNGKSSPHTVATASHDKSSSPPSRGEQLDSKNCTSSPAQASLTRTRFLRRTKRLGRPSPLSRQILPSIISFGSSSPGSPLDSSFQPAETNRLSIAGNRRGSMNFNSSVSTFPPATPTTPRDHSVFFAEDKGAIPIGLTKNDVDEAISSRFREVKELDGGEGEFSKVYRVSQSVQGSTQDTPAGSQVWVVKKSKKPYTGQGDRNRKMREVDILYALRGNDHVLNINDHWEANSHLYIQSEYCEGGNLRRFLDTVGYSSRLDDFRIWKILLELSQGLTFIHHSGYIHLDLKPANILIDFGGSLKIADFGLASSWPAPKGIDGEGDRHYLAPEALCGRFDKPADVFALGMMLTEIAGNCVIPENGTYWTKLRSGEFEHVLPSLTWSADSGTLSRDGNGDPIPESNVSLDTFLMSDTDIEPQSTVQIRAASSPEEDLARAPKFMIDYTDPNTMDQVVKAMLHPVPEERPTSEQVLQCFGCQWVDYRRRAGATVYEGNFGPGEDILATYALDDADADMMDMS